MLQKAAFLEASPGFLAASTGPQWTWSRQFCSLDYLRVFSTAQHCCSVPGQCSSIECYLLHLDCLSQHSWLMFSCTHQTPHLFVYSFLLHAKQSTEPAISPKVLPSPFSFWTRFLNQCMQRDFQYLQLLMLISLSSKSGLIGFSQWTVNLKVTKAVDQVDEPGHL